MLRKELEAGLGKMSEIKGAFCASHISALCGHSASFFSFSVHWPSLYPTFKYMVQRAVLWLF